MASGKRILKQGPIEKQTSNWRKNWKERWLVLDTEELSYYRSERAYKSDELAVHHYKLEQILLVEYVQDKSAKVSVSHTHNKSLADITESKRFRLKTTERCFELKCDNSKDSRDWVSQLQSVCPNLTDRDSKDGMSDDEERSVLSQLKKDISSGGTLTGVPASPHHIERPKLATHNFKASDFDSYPSMDTTMPARPDVSDDGMPILVGLLPSVDGNQEVKELDFYTLDEFYETLVGAGAIGREKELNEFQECALLYHKCFLDSSEVLLIKLTEIFVNPAEKFSDPKQVIAIRITILDLLNRWAHSYIQDFSKPMRERVNDFIDKAIDTVILSGATAQAMESAIKEYQQNFDKLCRQAANKVPAAAASSSNFLRKFADGRDLLLIEPRDAAEQLTLYEWELFSRVTPREFINGNWVRKGAQIASPNVCQMTESFNKMILWIGTEILKRPEQADRIKIMRMFVRMGCECLELGNYWGAYEIASGLWFHPVYRLKSHWSVLPKNIKKDYDTLVQATGVVDGDFTGYRKTLRDGIGKSQIPQVPLHLKDLISFDSLDTFNKEGKLNFLKYLKQYRILMELLQNQRSVYHIENKDEIRLAILKGAEQSMTKEDMTQLSFQYEPKKVKPGGGAASPSEQKQ
eukprot:TRINITY_DN35564_c0_g1_i1.p1 TRINITY_DN35564_c0_g1~~TRINITY_DN35564_c0_g1_i1.p1  ORF type:complete len:635 (-),score=135.21 TRINITY_DN35564_c0_g1_i1:39-1943(-)